MSELPKPAFVDNPVMAGAFASFMDWIWRQDDAHAAFCEDSGMTRPSPARNALDRAIDEAAGYGKEYMGAFVAWAIRTQWGEDGDPALDDEDPA